MAQFDMASMTKAIVTALNKKSPFLKLHLADTDAEVFIQSGKVETFCIYDKGGSPRTQIFLTGRTSVCVSETPEDITLLLGIAGHMTLAKEDLDG